MEGGKVSGNIIPHEVLGDFVLSTPATLGSVDLEVLVLRRGELPLKATERVPLNYGCCLSISHFFSQRPTGKKRNYYFGRNDPDHQDEDREEVN